MLNDNINLAACVLHLQQASKLINKYDTNISLTLLELIDAIISTYNIDTDQINQIELIKTEILKGDNNG